MAHLHHEVVVREVLRVHGLGHPRLQQAFGSRLCDKKCRLTYVSVNFLPRIDVDIGVWMCAIRFDFAIDVGIHHHSCDCGRIIVPDFLVECVEIIRWISLSIKCLLFSESAFEGL